jgi:pyruvate-formate lyase-activating enzyme
MPPVGSAKYGTLLFALSYRCNIRCRICSVGPLLESRTSLSFEVASRVVDEAARLGNVRNIAFTGGEPFLQYKMMLALLEHARTKHGWCANVTSNCSWATSANVADKRLAPLVRNGLTALLVSLDDFHLDEVTLESFRIAIESARAMGVLCQVQTVVTKSSRKADDFRAMLDGFASDPGVTWLESRCSPVGFASRQIDPDDLPSSRGVMMGGCTLYRFIAVMPNGDVGLCCSFFPSSLAVGNVHDEGLAEILARAESNSLVNAVFLWGGPTLVAEMLRREGRPEFAERSYTNVCHACHEILSDPEALALTRPALDAAKEELSDARREAEEDLHYLDSRADQRAWYSSEVPARPRAAEPVGATSKTKVKT